MPFARQLFFLILLGLQSSALLAAGPMLTKDPEVPPNLAFVRSIDVDTFVESMNYHGLGAQSGRVRLRLLDPDMQAFVGMLIGFHHFNQDLRIGDPQNPDTAGVMANWGGDFGIVRGKHLWELDLMGANLSQRLGFAVAGVGEHRIRSNLLFYHRTEFNVFVTDAILDQDQGFYWMWKPTVGFSAGYRWFTSSHMDRSGPHLGLRLYFESPKIPFIFPSLG